MRQRILALAGTCGFVAAGVLSDSTEAAASAPASPTFTRDIAPLLYKNCVSCHRPGEIAPMSLLTFKDARPWAKAIREQVATGTMPPWHPDPSYGQWENDRRLARQDIDTIVRWVDQGAKEGNPADLPPAPRFVGGWQIGEPDMIFRMPTEFTVPAEGAVRYQHFTVPTEFKEDRYVTAMEARAGNLAVVHHIVIYVREPGARRPAKPNIADGILGALSPGMTPFMARPGTAKLIRAGSQLVFQMHYTPNGVEQKDRSMLGLIFAKEPVERVILPAAAYDTSFVIPPGASNHEVKAVYEFDEDSHVVSLMPHMHLRGKDVVYRAVYPGGRSETLLSVPKYDFNWQVYYYPRKPLAMPKGTRIEAVAHFDNSKNNPLNPDPDKAVRFGEQTWDEMMNGFFDYTVDSDRGGEARSR